MACKGWPAQEVWDSLYPALGLAESLRRTDALVPILCGLYVWVFCRGRVAELLVWVERAMNAAETYGDLDLLILGHFAALNAHYWLGDPVKTREHADRVLTLYTEDRHAHLVGMLNHDPTSRHQMRSSSSSCGDSIAWRSLRPLQLACRLSELNLKRNRFIIRGGQLARCHLAQRGV
jgi:hypothetical protein